MLKIVLEFIFCFGATVFFALLMSAPSKSILPTSVIAALGYAGCMYIARSKSELLGYLVATVFICICGEVCARIMKFPALIFVFPAIIPLVPGIGLYETVLAFVKNDIQKGLNLGTRTMLIAIVIAASIAVTSAFMRSLFNLLKKPQKNAVT